MAKLIAVYAYSGENIEYIGEARPGAAKANAVWRIQKLTYSGSNITGSYWASGTDSFDKIWDDGVTTYASYTYA